MSMKNNYIIVYGDGACSGNPGVGGYAAYITTDDTKIVVIGGDPYTTNNQMELQSAVHALTYLRDKRIFGKIVLNFDSKYVLDGMEQWVDNWSNNNWKTSNRKPVKNEEQWKKLKILRDDMIQNGCTFEYIHVKGHSGNELNEYVDSLAVGACQITREKSINWSENLDA